MLPITLCVHRLHSLLIVAACLLTVCQDKWKCRSELDDHESCEHLWPDDANTYRPSSLSPFRSWTETRWSLSKIVICVQGAVCTGLWVIAHECGHQAFSKWQLLNDSVGIVLHSCLLVPYFSWWEPPQICGMEHLHSKFNLILQAVLSPFVLSWERSPPPPFPWYQSVNHIGIISEVIVRTSKLISIFPEAYR